MNPFRYAQPRDASSAYAALVSDASASYLAGGTNVIDLMKDDVIRPGLLVDLSRLSMRGYTRTATGVRIGALETMADVADRSEVSSGFPVVATALLASASPQLRNLATIGGNVLQRTRCAYFRDVTQPCNKRSPGKGCSAIAGDNRRHAVIGGSEHCICTNPSDFATALLAVDAVAHTNGPAGARTIPIERLYVLPGTRPDIEHTLERGELIDSIELASSAHALNSTYLKIRDRASYEFALVSVAAGLDVSKGRIAAARVALGSVAPVPWRSHEAEAELVGAAPSKAVFERAAQAATSRMRGYGKNDYKIAMVRRAIVRGLVACSGGAA